MNMVEFAEPPEMGTVLSLDEQDYELVGITPHERADGAKTTLLVWDTTCPTCGDGFEVMSGLSTKGINRRCAGCRVAGKPVKGRRSRKVKVSFRNP
jgi:hypothetical protein